MAEREQWADAFGVEPAVADVDALFIVDVLPAGVCAERVGRGVLDSYREREVDLIRIRIRTARVRTVFLTDFHITRMLPPPISRRPSMPVPSRRQ